MQDQKKFKKISDSDFARYLAGDIIEEHEVRHIEAEIDSNAGLKRDFQKFHKIWRVTGILNELEFFDIEEARKKVTSKILSGEIFHRFLDIWEKIAAILLIPLFLSFLLFHFISNAPQNNPDGFQTITVALGTTSHVNLPDGTGVWINSGSTLKYRLPFSKDNRKVNLDGEAFFEIARTNNSPFVVSTSHLDIEATGTSFNVTAYSDENIIETTLVNGKVILSGKLNGLGSKIRTELPPGVKATFIKDEEKIFCDQVNTDKITSWKEGRLVFQNESMDQVVRRMERWFNTDIELMNPELDSYRYSATFNDETLIQVLELLKISAPIEYSYSPRIRNADNTFCKCKVEISLKD